MSEELEPAPVVVPEPFTEYELVAYRLHLEAVQQGKEFPLAPSLQAELFQAFLSGESMLEIVRRHKGLRLGQVVRAAKEGDWFRLRNDYRDQLLNEVLPRVRQSQAEGLRFTAGLMAATHKRFGDKVQRYLETGDESLLGDLVPKTLDGYRKLVQIQQMLTGQDAKKKPGRDDDDDDEPGPKEVGGREPTLPQILPPRALSSADAEDLLAKLEAEDEAKVKVRR